MRHDLRESLPERSSVQDKEVDVPLASQLIETLSGATSHQQHGTLSVWKL